MKKFNMLVQSLSPVFILTIIKIFPINFKFLFNGSKGNFLNWIKIFFKHIITFDKVYIVLLFCFFASLWAFVSFIFFRDSASVGFKSGYTINSVSNQEDASLNFFFFFLFPLIVDDFSTWNSFCYYFALVFLTGCLLWKTTLFYKNPVLTLLNYNVINFKFEDNTDEPSENLIGISREILKDKTNIKYKELLPKVYYLKKIEDDTNDKK